MRNVYYALAFAALQLSTPTNAQGCADMEPNDPYCFLPLYEDQEFNATFDDLALHSVVGDYREVSWDGVVATTNKTHDQVVPHSINNYAHAETGEVVLSATTDYLYLIGFYFGCSYTGANSTQMAQACTVQVEGMCLPVGFPAYVGGQLEPLNWTFQYKPHFTNNSKMANLTYASPYQSKTTFDGVSKTEHPVLCTNYTITAKTRSAVKASLLLDDVNIATYTYSYY